MAAEAITLSPADIPGTLTLTGVPASTDPASLDPALATSPPTDAAEAQGHDPLTALGADVFHLVLSELTVHELLLVESVCTTWRAFSRSNAPLWNTVARGLGVDMPEWRRTVGEREAWEHRQAEREKEWALLENKDKGVGELNGMHQGQEKATNGVYTTESGEEQHTSPRLLADPAVPYRDATMGHLELQANWAQRHLYETLIPTPAFKLRHIAVDPTEDTIYALTESAPTKMDKLLVLDRYTGKLLLTVPWIVRNATMSVGAGYVVIASAPGIDHDEEADWQPKADPVKELHVYRTAKAAERAAQVAKRTGATPPPEFKHDRGLPLEFFTTVTALSACRAFRVKLDTRSGRPQAVLAGVAEGKVLLCHLENDLRIETIIANRVQTIDACTCNRRPSPRPRVYLQDINFDDDSIYILTQYQCHVINRSSGGKLIAFPHPYQPSNHHAALGYNVPFNYPFLYGVDSRATTTPARAPPSVRLALVASSRSGIRAVRSDTDPQSFDDMLDEEDEDDIIGGRAAAADLRSIILTDKYMVIRSEEGEAIVIRNPRQVFAEAHDLDGHERTRHIAAHSVIIKMQEHIEDLHVWEDRLVCHSAEITIFVFDLSQIPDLPLPHDWVAPPTGGFVLEISCLQGMQERSSIAVDARGIYLADWDLGRPTTDIVYEPLHSMHVDDGLWGHEIRPNWGCIKIWTARPESTLLTYNYPRYLTEAMENGTIYVADYESHSESDSDSEGDSDSDSNSEEEEEEGWVSDSGLGSGMDETELLDAMASMSSSGILELTTAFPELLGLDVDDVDTALATLELGADDDSDAEYIAYHTGEGYQGSTDGDDEDEEDAGVDDAEVPEDAAVTHGPDGGLHSLMLDDDDLESLQHMQGGLYASPSNAQPFSEPEAGSTPGESGNTP